MKYLGIVVVFYLLILAYMHVDDYRNEKFVLDIKAAPGGYDVEYIQHGDTLKDRMTYVEFEIFLK